MRFLTRNQAALQVGCFDAAAIMIWRRKGHPLPKGYRPALMVNGEVYPAKSCETLHAQIRDRVQTFGETVEEGFCFD